MRNTFVLILFLFSSLLNVSWAQSMIVPRPNAIQISPGHCQLNANIKYNVTGKSNQETRKTLNYLSHKINKLFNDQKKADPTSIQLKIDNKLPKDESYVLSIRPKSILITSGANDGLYWGVQSLLQLLPVEVESSSMPSAKQLDFFNLPCMEIKDSPRFSWRGIHLDPSRHFLSINEIKKLIDVLSLYKINKVHLHLTDDQGWRLEIKRYPKLTSVGANRLEPEGNITHGYYTQKEIKDLVKYAQQRHIEIIPEIEMPGHELAAIAAYPALSCKSLPTTPRLIWGVEDVVMCPGKENMFVFLQNVLKEVCDLFPSPYIHIGGDECPRDAWKSCPNCQSRMKQLGYKDEAQLQDYVIDRIGKFLKKKHKKIIGWDEILEGGNLQKDAIVMSWRGEEGGISAASKNHYVIMSPGNQGMYFDHYQGDIMSEKTSIGGYAPINKVYQYNPVPSQLLNEGKTHYILGVQANNWSEYTLNGKELENRLFPRALALAEVGWGESKYKDFLHFMNSIYYNQLPRLKYHEINYYIPQPSITNLHSNYLAFMDSVKLDFFVTYPKAKIMYALDDSIEYRLYNGPISIGHTCKVYSYTLLPNGEKSSVRKIYVQKQSPLMSTLLAHPTPGVFVDIYKGDYRHPEEINFSLPSDTVLLTDIRKIKSLTIVPKDVRNVDNYAALAKGFLKIDSLGIYELSSTNAQVFINDSLIIDNSKVYAPRDTRMNTQLVLDKGYYPIKILFMGGIFGGWPTYWNDGDVKIRSTNGKFESIQNKLYYSE